MFCGKCGKENVDGASFCVGCGADLARLTPGSAPGPTDPLGAARTASAARNPADTLDAARTIHADQLCEGKLLAGQYRILDKAPLGSGGMGEVWKAEDTELGAVVAIKVLPPVLARDRSAIAGLKREAAIGRQLTHRNICRLYSFHSDGDLKFIVMEYVAGQTLAELLSDREDRKLSWKELEPIVRQVAEALDFAHGATYTDASGRQVTGVLHRDIKPQNIMVTSNGAAKLMDFGIAREIHNTMTQITGRTSQTPLYASPEQFRGEPMTAASDIYSFTAVLYECLAGRSLVSPHGDLRYQIMEKPFDSLSSQSATANAMLAAGLSDDPAKRPGTGADLLAFEERVEKEPETDLPADIDQTGTAPAEPVTQPPPPAQKPHLAQSTFRPPAPSSRSPSAHPAKPRGGKGWLWVGVIVMAIVSFGYWILNREQGGSNSEQAQRQQNATASALNVDKDLTLDSDRRQLVRRAEEFESQLSQTIQYLKRFKPVSLHIGTKQVQVESYRVSSQRYYSFRISDSYILDASGAKEVGTPGIEVSKLESDPRVMSSSEQRKITVQLWQAKYEKAMLRYRKELAEQIKRLTPLANEVKQLDTNKKYGSLFEQFIALQEDRVF